MKIKRILGSVFFLLLVLCILTGVTWLLRDRATTLSAMYSEPDDTLDVIIVGSSHVNNGYIPNLLWEENHASACNVFSWSQPMWVSYHYIKETLRTQQPSVVVLEMFGMTYGHSYIMPEEIDRTSYANSFNLDPGLNRLQLIATSERCGLDLRDSSEFLNLVRYHTRWKYLNEEMFTCNPHDQYDYLKGYGFVLAAGGLADPAIPTPEEPFEPYEYCIEYLDKIVELCNKEGIRLILTMAPYIYNETEAGICRWIELYAQEHGLTFLNYNGEDGKRIGFDYATDLIDIGHCNYAGALKLTQDLCHHLAQNHTFPAATEHPNHRALSDDLAKYHRLIPLNDIMSHETLAVWLTSALADSETTILLYDTGNNTAASTTLHNTLEQLGMPVSQKYAVLSKDGILSEENTVSLPLFETTGTVFFADTPGCIQINGTAVPAPENTALTMVLYDAVLQRPVQCVWIDSEGTDTLSRREFTSDILPLYQ